MDIFLKDYLYCGDNTLAMAEALRKCGDGDILHLGGGEIVFERDFAEPMNYYLPRYSDKTKYYAIYAKNKKNITIDGDGAKLLFKGDISAFGFDNCDGLVLKNFSIDNKYMTYAQAKITAANEDYFEVEFDEENFPCEYDEIKKVLRFSFNNGEFLWEADSMLSNEFSPETKAMTKESTDYFLCVNAPDPVYDFMSVTVKTEVLEHGKFRFWFIGKKIKHTVGNYIVMCCHERRNANIHMHRCKNIVMENIDMYSSGSFGVIGLLCENIYIRNVNSVLKPDSEHLVAVVADMFHCVNCRGMIDIGNCTIENTEDDCVNIHSLFVEPVKVLDKHTLIVKIPYKAKRALNLFEKGEKLHKLTKGFFEQKDEVTVRSSEFLGQYHLRLELEEEVDKSILEMYLESTDAMPKIYLHDCRCGNNRGRGFLVSSNKKSVIENNIFYNGFTAITVGGASAFYAEGGAVKDLTIKGNHFKKQGCAININPQSIVPERMNAYHSNIRIENNTFSVPEDKAVIIRLAENVTMKDNKFEII